LSVYADVTPGWELAGFTALRDTWAQYMPSWGSGLSYPLQVLGDIIGGNGSAMVLFTDTPELFGAEMRVCASVDVSGGRITRWADCWDSVNYEADVYRALKLAEPDVPLALRSEPAIAADRISRVSESLAAAVSAGDAEAAAGLFTYDATFDDRGARIRVGTFATRTGLPSRRSASIHSRDEVRVTCTTGATSMTLNSNTLNDTTPGCCS
jgi:hypothetical protein